MKKQIIVTILICLLLAGCVEKDPGTSLPTLGTTAPSKPAGSVPESTAPTISTTAPTVPSTNPQNVTFDVYYADESFVDFTHKSVTLEGLTPQAVLNELIALQVVNSDVILRDAFLDGTQLNLDLSVDFLEQLWTLGTTGERFLVGSVVNTFISAYGVESVMITVDGDLMDSGHVVYDMPMTFFE